MKLFVSTADASGDLHAAALVEALRKRVPELHAFGLGGASLEAAGVELVVRQAELAVAGLVEVLSSATRIARAYRALRRALVGRAPDACLLVDSPDLNLPLAAVAKRRGIPVIYYVAPQVWAWRTGRVRKLRRRVDRLAVILPFEEEFLRGHGVPATFVGHPLVDRMRAVSLALRPKEVAAELGIDLERPLLGLLPGSRHNELRANLDDQIEAARLLRGAFPELQVLLLLAPTLADQRPLLPGWLRVLGGRTHEAMALATCLIAAPGTVTLEATLLGTPLVVAHRVNSLSFEIARRLVRVPSSALPNLIAEAGVVPERLQGMARPAAIAAVVAPLLADPVARERMRRALAEVAARHGSPGASERAAALVLEVAGGG